MRRIAAGIVIGIIVAGAVGGYYYHRLVVAANFGVVVEGKVYRSAQPSPDNLRDWAARYGLKTVINLRGDSARAGLEQERQLAAANGMDMILVRFSAVDLPSALQLRNLVDALETAPRPLLLHCRAGADRTGVAAAMAAMAVGGEDYAAAKSHLSEKYFHFDNDPEHIGGLFVRYEKYCRDHGQATGGWNEFRKWAVTEYYPRYYRVAISAPASLRARPGQTVEFAAGVANATDQVIPCSRGIFNLAVFLGTSVAETPDRELGPRVAVKGDIAPGQSAQVRMTMTAPDQPGDYPVHLDLLEEHVTWFARQGSPMGLISLNVEANDAAATTAATTAAPAE